MQALTDEFLNHTHHPPEIAAREVSKTYTGVDELSVDRVSFHVPPGSLTVLIGPSGCGKTTLLKMVNRLVEPDSGQVLIDGREVHEFSATLLRRKIGYVIQQVGLFPHMNVAQNIAVVPRLEGWSKPAIRERVYALLEMLDLPAAYAGRYPRQLSGGEQQRVGIARALAANPGLLLMDEPFGALDAITRKNLQDQMLHLQRQMGKTVLFVTHDIEEALKLGDQVLIMRAGRLVQTGSPLEVISRPADAFVSQLVGGNDVLQRLSVLTAGDLLARGGHANGKSPEASETVRLHDDLRTVLAVMLACGTEQVRVCGADGQTAGVIHFNDLREVLA